MVPIQLAQKLFIDHIVLVISDIRGTKDFYSKIFGEPSYQDDASAMYRIGPTKLFLMLPHGKLPVDDVFSPNRIGLEHFAIAIEAVEDLKEIEMTLNEGFIRHSGIHIDSHSHKEKIWLDDPDKIRIEFYT
jgi:glyoxylase I family protein